MVTFPSFQLILCLRGGQWGMSFLPFSIIPLAGDKTKRGRKFSKSYRQKRPVKTLSFKKEKKMQTRKNKTQTQIKETKTFNPQSIRRLEKLDSLIKASVSNPFHFFAFLRIQKSSIIGYNSPIPFPFVIFSYFCLYSATEKWTTIT